MRGICYEKINNWESAESDLLASININNNLQESDAATARV